MKYFVASDIHGSASCCQQMLEKYRLSDTDRLLLLGDLLYHGPRNDLPEEYAPKKVIEMLNQHRDEILCVRGNCEAEVDQMVLEFPVMADYCILALGSRMVFATHGHHFHREQLPPMKAGDILLHGHTHVLAADMVAGKVILNPGSVSLPKEGNPRSYGILTAESFSIYNFQDKLIKEMLLNELNKE